MRKRRITTTNAYHSNCWTSRPWICPKTRSTNLTTCCPFIAFTGATTFGILTISSSSISFNLICLHLIFYRPVKFNNRPARSNLLGKHSTIFINCCGQEEKDCLCYFRGTTVSTCTKNCTRILDIDHTCR